MNCDKKIIEKIKEIEEYARVNHVPIVREQTLQFLLKQLKVCEPKNILEIGTAIGYSAIQMLLISENSKLTTIEKNETSYNIAKQNFYECDVLSRIEMKLGDAYDVLSELCEDNRKYEFVFLDGPKAQYIKYMPLIEKLCNLNAIIFADDVLFYGMVKSNIYPHRKKTIVVGLQNFLEYIKNSEKFESQVYDIEDGFAVIKVLKNS